MSLFTSQPENQPRLLHRAEPSNGSIKPALSTPPEITFIAKHSTALTMEDIPCKVDLIVAELVDTGLLGEKIVASLKDAVDRFLAPGGAVIPSGAQVFAVLIESDAMTRSFRLLWDAPHSFTARLGLQHGSVRVTLDEPYICETLLTRPHRKLCKPFAATHITFPGTGSNTGTRSGDTLEVAAEAGQRKGKAKDASGAASSSSECQHVAITAPGRVDGIACWYSLELDTTTAFSTAPSKDSRCGHDQAIFGLEVPFDVGAGSAVSVTTTYDDDTLAFCVAPGQQQQQQQTAHSSHVAATTTDGPTTAKATHTTAAATRTGSTCSHTNCGPVHVRVQDIEMSLLNCSTRHSALLNAVRTSADGLLDGNPTATGMDDSSPEQIIIVVMAPSFCPVALGLAKSTGHKVIQVCCPRSKVMFDTLAAENGGSTQRLACAASSAEAVDVVVAHAQGTRSKVVVVSDCIEQTGLIDADLFAASCALKHVLAERGIPLAPDPLRMKIRCVAVSSQLVTNLNSVKAENTGSVDVTAINRYSVATLVDISTSEVGDLQELTDAFDGPLLSSSAMNFGAACTVGVTAAGRVTALLLWLDLVNVDGIVVFSARAAGDTYR